MNVEQRQAVDYIHHHHLLLLNPKADSRTEGGRLSQHNVMMAKVIHTDAVTTYMQWLAV